MFILVLPVFFFLQACATSKKAELPEPLTAASYESTLKESAPPVYRFQVGDIFDVKFHYDNELDENAVIRPDGKISLRFVGEVEAAGFTPKELEEVLLEKYSKVLNKPEFTLIIRKYSPQKVYVGGEVLVPGVVALDARQTALQAIFQTGGFKNTAEPQSVVILRKGMTKTPVFITLNLEDALNGVNKEDIELEPFDIVFVPKSTIARMDQFVEQYIDKLIPITRTIGLGFNYNLNPEVTVR